MLGQALAGLAIFTAIEVVGLGEWLRGSGVTITTYGKIILIVVLYLEHFVSLVVGLNIGAKREFYANPF